MSSSIACWFSLAWKNNSPLIFKVTFGCSSYLLAQPFSRLHITHENDKLQKHTNVCHFLRDNRNIHVLTFLLDATPRRGGPRRTPQRSTPQRSTPQRDPKQNPDDGVDISYVGANIPSKSFQFLQQSISQPAQTPSTGRCHHRILFYSFYICMGEFSLS